MNQYFRDFITYAQEIEEEGTEFGDDISSEMAITIEKAVNWRATVDKTDREDIARQVSFYIWQGYLRRFYDLADQLDTEFNAAFPTENKEE